MQLKTLALIIISFLNLSLISSEPPVENAPQTNTEQWRPSWILIGEIAAVSFGSFIGAKELFKLMKYYVFDVSKNYVLHPTSDIDLRYAPLNMSLRNVLTKLNAQEFEQLYLRVIPEDISDEEIKELRKNILEHYNLYQFPGFRMMIEMMPQFDEHIITTSLKLKKDRRFHRKIHFMQGFKSGELCKYIHQKAYLALGKQQPQQPTLAKPVSITQKLLVPYLYIKNRVMKKIKKINL